MYTYERYTDSDTGRFSFVFARAGMSGPARIKRVCDWARFDAAQICLSSGPALFGAERISGRTEWMF